MQNPLHLTLVDGPDDPLVGSEVLIDREDATLGRSTSCDYCLPAPSVSRSHARAQHREGRWFLADLGSTSGTFVNGLRLERDQPVLLDRGDDIVMGPWRFRVGGGGHQEHPTLALTTTTTLATATAHAPSRRLEALSRCIEHLSRAQDERALACALLDSALDGAGFRRGAVLRASGEDVSTVEVIEARERRSGGIEPLEQSDLQPSSALIEMALQGQTAVFSERTPGSGAVTSESLMEMSVHSAICVPVRIDGRVGSLLYLDSRAGEAQVRDATSYCEDLAQIYGLSSAYAARAELQRRQAAMQAELERARSLRAMLNPPLLVDAPPYRIAHRTIAGMYVSGDLFDVVRQLDGSSVVLFGDATGHGVGAAMLTALVHANIHAHIARHPSPVEALTATNRFIAERPAGGSFVSLWAGLLTPTGQVTLCDAGHGYALLIRAGGAVERMPKATGIPVGIDAEARYEDITLNLQPGDRIVLYTDGVPEQRGDDGEQLGDEGVAAALVGSTSSEDDVTRIVAALVGPDASRAPDDDATVASIEFQSV
ncbi:MAG: SpoIIE family protein phosphatase [Planctomycetota bacterium]